MKNKVYYFDATSTTKPYDEVLELNNKILNQYYANSDALYSDGIASYRLQEKARTLIADLVNVKANEVIFTQGASIANNLAIKGVVFQHFNTSRKHLITTMYEHPSVLNVFKQLEAIFGYEVDYLKPNQDGLIDIEILKEKLRKDTLLVSIMAVNNEVGYLNDVDKLGAFVKRNSNAYFHSDITQAITKVSLSFKNIDLASFSGHKIGGLKGSGVLIKKQHLMISPLICGGQQEFSLNAGTSNYAANISLAKALELSFKNFKKHYLKIEALYYYLIDELKKIKAVSIISNAFCIKNIVMIKTNILSEVMMNALNEQGICISSKSTCKTKDNKKSATALAMGYDGDYCIRISLDHLLSFEDINYLCKHLKRSCEKYGI